MLVEVAAPDIHVADHHLDACRFGKVVEILLHGILREAVSDGENPYRALLHAYIDCSGSLGISGCRLDSDAGFTGCDTCDGDRRVVLAACAGYFGIRRGACPLKRIVSRASECQCDVTALPAGKGDMTGCCHRNLCRRFFWLVLGLEIRLVKSLGAGCHDGNEKKQY